MSELVPFWDENYTPVEEKELDKILDQEDIDQVKTITKNYKNMKKSLFFMLLTAIICSCNPIPNKPFYEELTLDELAKAIKADEEFAEWYEELMDSRLITRTTDVEKAKYKDVTHRRLFKYSKHMYDFKYWIRFDSISNLKWEEEYASTIKSVDSLVAVKKELKKQFVSVVARLNISKVCNTYDKLSRL